MKILRRVGFVLLSCMIFSPLASAAPFGYAADGDSSTPAPFYRIDFATNTITQVGSSTPRLEALSFGPGGTILYGFSDSTESLYTVNKSNGTPTLVGPLGVSVNNPGMAFCPDNQTMYLVDSTDDGRLFSINLSTGQGTLIGSSTSLPYSPSGLACSKTGILYAVASNTDSLYTVSRSTGQATLVGSLGIDISNSGLGDLGDRLVLVTDRTPTILYEVNRNTGAATALTQLSASGLNLESLAVDVEAAGGPLEVPVIPTLSEWLMLLLAGLVGIFGFARLRRA